MATQENESSVVLDDQNTEPEADLEEFSCQDNPDIDRGWAWVVLFASWGAQVLCGGAIASVGVLYVYMLEAFHEDPAKTAWVGSLFSGLSSFVGPVASVLCSLCTVRYATMAGGLILAAGFAVSSQVHNLNLMFLTFGVVAGFGLGMAHLPAAIASGYYFLKKRTLVLVIATTGLPIGLLLVPPVLSLLENQYGWRGCTLLLAGLCLHICVFGCLIRPSVLEKKAREKNTCRRKTMLGVISQCFSCEVSFLRSGRFSCFLLANIFINFGMNAIFLHLPNFALSKGASRNEVPELFLYMGIANILPRLLIGPGTNRAANHNGLDKLILLIGSISILSLATLLFPFYSSTAVGRKAYAWIFAFYFGVVPGLNVPITIDLVGLSHLSSGMGLVNLATGIGLIIGPPFAALLKENTGRYENSFILAGAAFIMAVLMLMSMTFFSKPEVTTSTSDSKDQSTVHEGVPLKNTRNDANEYSSS